MADYSGWLWAVIDIVAVVILAAVMFYAGTSMPTATGPRIQPRKPPPAATMPRRTATPPVAAKPERSQRKTSPPAANCGIKEF